MKAKKSLGQHFLKSEKALNTIIREGELKLEDVVLEIGPGQGALTEKLLATGINVLGVEKDDGLYKFLEEKFEKELSSGQLTLIHGDILDFDPSSHQLEARSYKLIANIPYNITGAILKKFLSTDCQPERMVLLVQKEVADRIMARDGKESILSLSIKAYGKPYFVDTVKAGSFAPAPKVDSAILAICDISKDYFSNFSEQVFFDILHAGFGSKRKKLSSNLSNIYPKEKVLAVFEEINLNQNTRAEDIPPEIWAKLAKILVKIQIHQAPAD
jgi:16S rRNA (adenine1518-N6/adenine1519-N6)-dimethyltransferase